MRPAAQLAPAPLQICVVGAGNLGQAQAGHLASLGHSVRIYNRSRERLASIAATSRVRLTGAVNGEAKLASVGTDLATALEGARIVFIDVPATGHADLARALAPLLDACREPPLLVLHPGQTFGARHFAEELRRSGLREPPPVCELQTALYTSRLGAGGEASVLALKRRVSTAVYPQARAEAAGPLRALYPQLIPAPSTLHTGLTNLQGIIHPAVCLLNLARIERGERFRLYREGLSPGVGAFFEAADRERLAICEAMGVKVPTAAQWFALSYGVRGPSTFEAMQQVSAYETLEAPSSLSTRLLWEDVPTGLVPLLSLAALLRVQTPALEALLRLARIVCGPALDREGWTLERLGLAGKSAAEIRRAL
ncbi:MAG: NAD/NADP octopine/nopaline dehydrogenase family protein [Myxococcales bacterium]